MQPTALPPAAQPPSTAQHGPSICPVPQPQPHAHPPQPHAEAPQPAAEASQPTPDSSQSGPSPGEPAGTPQLTPSDAALVQAASDALQSVLHAEIIVGTQQTVAEYHAEAAKSAFGVQVEHLSNAGSARAQPTALFLYDYSSRHLHGLWLSEPSHSRNFPSVRLPSLLLILHRLHSPCWYPAAFAAP